MSDPESEAVTIPQIRRVYRDTKANLDALTGVREEDLSYGTDTGILYRYTSGAWSAIASPTDSGEGHIILLAQDYDSIGQGTYVTQINSSQFFNGAFYNSSLADGDNISYKVFLAAGTYTLRLLVMTGSNAPILDVDIDAAEVASFDLYTGSTVYNSLQSQVDIAVATSGLKTLKLRVDGKNGSSSSYKASVSVIALWRTA